MLEIAIKNILKEVTGLKVTPIFGTGKPPFITYTVTPQSGGSVKSSQVEVKIIDKDFDNALDIKDKVLKKLDLEENKPSLVNGNVILRGSLSGGGQLFNDAIQMWELSCIFIVTWRCE